jgi:hypothetical protein
MAGQTPGCSPLVEALGLLLRHLPAEHHLLERLRWLHRTENRKLQAGRTTSSLNNDRGEWVLPGRPVGNRGGRSPGAAGGWMAAWPRRTTPAAPPPARSAGPPSTCGTSSPAPASPCRTPLPPPLLSFAQPSLSLSLSCWRRTGGGAPWPWFLSLARLGAAGVSLSKKARVGVECGVEWKEGEGSLCGAHGPHSLL